MHQTRMPAMLTGQQLHHRSPFAMGARRQHDTFVTPIHELSRTFSSD